MNRSVLIGSRALAYWFPEYKVNPQSDWDVITDEPLEVMQELLKSDNVEIHDPNFLDSFWFKQIYYSKIDHKLGIAVASPQALSIIKRSHLWRDLRFGKHIADYNKYLRKYAENYDTLDKEVLRIRTELSYKAFPQPHPKLNQKVEDFFDDAVEKKYSHDWLHELVAYYDKPLYTRLQDDPSSAWCKKEKWDELTHEDKIKCIAEEAHVIAIERFMVPSNWTAYPKLAYFKAVEKVCTTLCSGWFRDYAIDYFEEVINSYDQSKINLVKEKVNA